MFPNNTVTAGTANLHIQAAAAQQRSNPAQQSEFVPSLSFARHDTLTQKALPFRSEVTEQFPHLRAWNHHHYFIEGKDQVIRRFPSDLAADRKAATSVPKEMRTWPEMLGTDSSILNEHRSQRVVDFSGQDRQAKVVAGYELDPVGQVTAYEVDRQRVASLLEKRAVFALGAFGPSGEQQYMVCQNQVWHCAGAFACRDMLLTEGKSVAEVIALLGKDGPTATSRWMKSEELVKMLTDDWTDRPLEVSLKGQPHEKGLQELMEKLDKHGSCMLGFGLNTWVMLDSLEKVGPGHWKHRTRSPFHGSVVESHTKLGASGGQAGSQSAAPTFGSADMDRAPLHLDLTDASIAIFRSARLPSRGLATQQKEEFIGIPV